MNSGSIKLDMKIAKYKNVIPEGLCRESSDFTGSKVARFSAKALLWVHVLRLPGMLNMIFQEDVLRDDSHYYYRCFNSIDIHFTSKIN